jgi:hypothetical protein
MGFLDEKKKKTLVNVNIHKHQENLQKIGEMGFFFCFFCLVCKFD